MIKIDTKKTDKGEYKTISMKDLTDKDVISGKVTRLMKRMTTQFGISTLITLNIAPHGDVGLFVNDKASCGFHDGVLVKLIDCVDVLKEGDEITLLVNTVTSKKTGRVFKNFTLSKK